MPQSLRPSDYQILLLWERRGKRCEGSTPLLREVEEEVEEEVDQEVDQDRLGAGEAPDSNWEQLSRGNHESSG